MAPTPKISTVLTARPRPSRWVRLNSIWNCPNAYSRFSRRPEVQSLASIALTLGTVERMIEDAELVSAYRVGSMRHRKVLNSNLRDNHCIVRSFKRGWLKNQLSCHWSVIKCSLDYPQRSVHQRFRDSTRTCGNGTKKSRRPHSTPSRRWSITTLLRHGRSDRSLYNG